MTGETKPVCVVCAAPETRVMDGRSYCAEHGPGDLNPQPPVAVCELDGCGSAAAPGSRWCPFHQPHMDRQAA